MDIRKVKKLIELLEESGISEIEIREGEESVRISRHAPANAHYFAQPSIQNIAPNTAHQVVANLTPNDSELNPKVATGKVILAPMVGTFYRSQAPGEKSFIELGQTIQAGQVVCIIEAMKMLNQIESDFEGIVQSILVENGQPIEFGQPLFILE